MFAKNLKPFFLDSLKKGTSMNLNTHLTGQSGVNCKFITVFGAHGEHDQTQGFANGFQGFPGAPPRTRRGGAGRARGPPERPWAAKKHADASRVESSASFLPAFSMLLGWFCRGSPAPAASLRACVFLRFPSW